jgi:SAM-dependent methyltransferase
MDRQLRYRIKAFLPSAVIARARTTRNLAHVVRVFNGRHPRECPICGYRGRFAYNGVQPVVADGLCPGCRSIGRHRQHKLLIDRHPEWLDGKDLLHISAEPCFVDDYRRRARSYVMGDYFPAQGEVAVDIQSMTFADQSFDLVICHNVIEHVPDDRAALSEFFRVLRRGGVALLSAPLVDAWAETYENPAMQTPIERDLHFGQSDHFRIYGRDLYDRIRAAGFDLSVDVAREPEVARYGLERGETIFIATRPAKSPSE